MSFTDSARQLFVNVQDVIYLAVPPADPPAANGTALPGIINSVAATLFAWGGAAVGLVAVLALMGAGLMFMHNSRNGQGNEGVVSVGKILAGVAVAGSAVAAVGVIM